MDKRLIKLLQSNKIKGEQIVMLDTYNQQVVEDVSCTIRTNINTANHHFILIPKMEDKIITVGNYTPSEHNATRVDYPCGVSPTVMQNHGSVIAIVEPMIGAMRSRNPNNPSERGKSNGNYQQLLEINENGTSNTITSVTKDNLVVESNTYGLSRTRDDKGNVTHRNLNPYTNALHSRTGHAHENMEVYVYEEETKSIYIPTATKKGFDEVPEGGVFDGSYPNSCTRRGRVQEKGEVSPTLTTECQPMLLESATKYRIRKLTQRECFRLMDVDDKYIDIIQASGIAKSQQYKLAGNSIVTNCLYHLFRKMFAEPQCESIEMSLF